MMEESYRSIEDVKRSIRREILQKEELIQTTKKSNFEQEKIERIVIGFTAEITAYQHVLEMLNRLRPQT